MPPDRRLLIDGKLTGGERTFPTLNPSTGEVLGYAPDATVAEAETAVRAARRAFDEETWATDRALRIRCLEQLYEALVKHKEELRELTWAPRGGWSRAGGTMPLRSG